jgi:hypothetical protein
VSEGWHEFYFMIGTTAGALIGLLFVVITLTANIEPGRAALGLRAYATPTVVHFASVLFVSAIALIPELSTRVAGSLLLIPCAGGLTYAGIVIRRFMGRLPSPPHWTDPIFYAVLPTLGYLALTAAAVAFIGGSAIARDVLATGALVLLFLGIRDAWDLASWLSTHPTGEP